MDKRTIDEIISYFNSEIIKKGKAGLEITAVSTDSRTIKEGEIFIPLKGDNFDGHAFIKEVIKKKPAAIIICKDYNDEKSDLIFNNDIWVFRVDDTLKAYHEIARNYLKSFRNLKKIAITGSAGKTTTKEIIKSLLSTKYKVQANEANYNNRVGVPKTALEIESDTQIAIFEMGMGAPYDIEKLAWIVEPDVAVITSIGEAHIEFFKNVEEIALTKKGIFSYFTDDCYSVLNSEDKFYPILIQGIKGKNLIINKNIIKIIDNLGLYGYKLIVNKKEIIFSLGGEHNLINLCFGLTVADIFNLSDNEIIEGIENISIPGMRNKIKEGNYTLIMDCYNANPVSMEASLAYLNNLSKEKNIRKIAVLADMLELGKESEFLHRRIGKYISNEYKDLYAVFTFGKMSEFIADEARKNDFLKDKVFNFTDKEKLLKNLKDFLRPKDIVLFKGSRGMKLEDIADSI